MPPFPHWDLDDKLDDRDFFVVVKIVVLKISLLMIFFLK